MTVQYSTAAKKGLPRRSNNSRLLKKTKNYVSFKRQYSTAAKKGLPRRSNDRRLLKKKKNTSFLKDGYYRLF
jgi:hypothetical protein